MTGWGFHEIEFAYRAVRAGARIVYDPAAEEYVRSKHALTALPRW